MKSVSYLVRICVIFPFRDKNKGQTRGDCLKVMGYVDVWEKWGVVLEVSPKLGKFGKDKDSEIAQRKFSPVFTCR